MKEEIYRCKIPEKANYLGVDFKKQKIIFLSKNYEIVGFGEKEREIKNFPKFEKIK